TVLFSVLSSFTISLAAAQAGPISGATKSGNTDRYASDTEWRHLSNCLHKAQYDLEREQLTKAKRHPDVRQLSQDVEFVRNRLEQRERELDSASMAQQPKSQDKKPSDDEAAKMRAEHEKAAKPGPEHATLAKRAGEYTTVSKSWMD